MDRKRVGVIGGGQLAWMMAEASQKLAIDLIVQTPHADDPAASIAAETIFANVDDSAATAILATHCDVITFENEFINLEALQKLATQGVCFRPSLDALSPLLDKYHQRSFLQKIGLSVPGFWTLEEKQSSESLQFPVVIKSRRLGYDGQGTFIVRDRKELEAISKRFGAGFLMLEEFIPFDRELAVMAARSALGEIVVYPVVETYQKDRVCHWTIAPAAIAPEIQAKIETIARHLLEKLQVIGIFGIELFLTHDGSVLVNEIAPRTHNSGHYTLDACEVSQFEMQLRAIADLSLGSAAMKYPGAVMVNLLGYETSQSDYLEKRDRIAALPYAYLHWYGKNESRPGRKLGHVTVLLNVAETAIAPPEIQQKLSEIARQVEAIWYE